MTFKQVSESLCRLFNINKTISDCFMPSCGFDLQVYLSWMVAPAFFCNRIWTYIRHRLDTVYIHPPWNKQDGMQHKFQELNVLCQSINKWRHTSSTSWWTCINCKSSMWTPDKSPFRQAPVYSARHRHSAIAGNRCKHHKPVVNIHHEGNCQSQESAPRNLLEDHSSTNLP